MMISDTRARVGRDHVARPGCGTADRVLARVVDRHAVVAVGKRRPAGDGRADQVALEVVAGRRARRIRTPSRGCRTRGCPRPRPCRRSGCRRRRRRGCPGSSEPRACRTPRSRCRCPGGRCRRLKRDALPQARDLVVAQAGARASRAGRPRAAAEAGGPAALVPMWLPSITCPLPPSGRTSAKQIAGDHVAVRRIRAADQVVRPETTRRSCRSGGPHRRWRRCRCGCRRRCFAALDVPARLQGVLDVEPADGLAVAADVEAGATGRVEDDFVPAGRCRSPGRRRGACSR